MISSLSKAQAKAIKNSILKFAVDSGENIMLSVIQNNNAYKKLNNILYKGIKKQIDHFAQVDTINRLIGMEKVDEGDKAILNDNLEREWLYILSLLDRGDFEKYYIDIASLSGQLALDTLTDDPDVFFNLNDQSLMSDVTNSIDIMASQIDSTTRKFIILAIYTGLKDGKSPLQISEGLKNISGKKAKSRAKIITDHETMLILNKVQKKVYRQNDVKNITWITLADELVCQICRPNHKKTIALGELFPSGHEAPPAHINCRCYVITDKISDIKYNG